MERLIDRILSAYRKNLKIGQDQEAILRYSLQVVISTLVSFLVALGVAFVVGIFYEVLLIMVSNAILRSVSGGAHCASARNCTIYGTMVSIGLGFVARYAVLSNEILFTMAMGVFFFAMWAMSKYAPADTPQKPIVSIKEKIKFKKQSLVVVCIWFSGITGIYILTIYGLLNIDFRIILLTSMGILYQSVSLTKAGYYISHKADMVIDIILGRRNRIC